MGGGSGSVPRFDTAPPDRAPRAGISHDPERDAVRPEYRRNGAACPSASPAEPGYGAGADDGGEPGLETGLFPSPLRALDLWLDRAASRFHKVEQRLLEIISIAQSDVYPDVQHEPVPGAVQ